MKACNQTDTQSVYEHGLSVWEYTQKILSKDWKTLKIPNWLNEHYDTIINNVHSLETIRDYNIYHDCGKPYCLVTDEQGKRHFPDHANVSAQTWAKLSDDIIIKELISLDMCLHTETADAIKARKIKKETILTLLVTALAEVHSNAQMFGGIDSTSFKIKYKKLDKRGRMIVREYLL